MILKYSNSKENLRNSLQYLVLILFPYRFTEWRFLKMLWLLRYAEENKVWK